jgi:hypothetical protein
MQSLRLIACLFLLSSLVLAQAPPPLTPQMSPMVTWGPGREISRPYTKRPLTSAELKAARARADRFYLLVKATPTFSQPAKHVTLVTAWPVVLDDGAVNETFYAYRSAPADVRRRADGSLWPKMGGVPRRCGTAWWRLRPDGPGIQPTERARFEPAASGSTGCVPIVRIRRDLVDLKRPNEVQLLAVFLPDDPCGEQWAGKAGPQSDRCAVAVPLMRELDWTAMRAVMGW